MSYCTTKLGFSKLPRGLNWKSILGAGMLGGIGFTMSIFITLLAYNNIHIIDNSKIAILMSSAIAGVIGLLFLTQVLPKPKLHKRQV